MIYLYLIPSQQRVVGKEQKFGINQALYFVVFRSSLLGDWTVEDLRKRWGRLNLARSANFQLLATVLLWQLGSFLSSVSRTITRGVLFARQRTSAADDLQKVEGIFDELCAPPVPIRYQCNDDTMTQVCRSFLSTVHLVQF
jgi:hypothetical protein